MPTDIERVSARGRRGSRVGGIGGGYGKATERPAAIVVEDVLDGYLTRKAAALVRGIIREFEARGDTRDFRVAIGADGTLDAAATTKLRAPG